MESIQDQAIVLRAVPFEDRHRVVTALTENHGRITALAKNSVQSRRFGGTLEPFAASMWTFTQKAGADLFFISDAQIKRDYCGISKDYDRLKLASALTEVMLRLAPEHESAPGLFRLHANALAWVEESSIESLREMGLLFLNHILLKALQLAGSLPQLDCCLVCESALSDWVAREMDLSAIISRAGWICPNCKSAGARTGMDQDSESGLRETLLSIPSAGLRDVLVSLKGSVRTLSESVQGLKIQRVEQERVLAWLESVLLFHAPGMERTPLKSFRFISDNDLLHPVANRP